MNKFLILALGAILCCTQVFAFDVSPTQINTGKKSNEKVQVSEELLKDIFTSKAFSSGVKMLKVTKDGQRVSSVRGELSSPLSGDLLESAKSYILENHKVFNLPPNRDVDIMRPVKVEKGENASHIVFQMFLNGVAVNEAIVQLHLDSESVVTLANGSFPTVNEIDNQIVIGKYQAIGQAKQAIKADKFRAVPQAELQIVPVGEGKARMAYVTRLSVENPLGDWEIVIDADNGDVIRMNNEMQFATGEGAVYVTNPLKCEVTTEPLYHLTTNTLTGKYAKIINEDTDESENAENVHIYDPENTHFDEVNMYNYITTIHDFYKNELGYDGLDKPMRAVVHKGTNYDNAYFSPWQQSFAFGDGDKFNDLAKEASVAYHEYSHAILHSITYLAYSGESGAINEGQADYFACTYTEDEALGEYVCAKMDRPYLRILENDLHYPEDIEGEVHADGKIWGATLWDIRQALGREISDKLIFKSHFYLNGSRPEFIDGYNAIVTADKNLFDGKNIQAIDEVFAKRGIIAENYNGAVLTESDLNKTKKFFKLHNEL
ncbi:MAG: M36 family metallopeptidase [Candidatus Rifleibacteriota bacterium]